MSTPPNLRRSGRIPTQKVPFTIENSPPIKKKRTHHSQRNTPVRDKTTVPKLEMVLTPPPDKDPVPGSGPHPGSVTDVKPKGTERVRKYVKIEQKPDDFTPTTYSNRHLETALIPGQPTGILYSCAEELRRKGINLTVKELLAQNFRNYKLRASQTSNAAERIVKQTLRENIVPEGVMLSQPPMIPPTVIMGSVYQPKQPRLVDTLKSTFVNFVRNATLQPGTLKSALDSLIEKEDVKEPDEEIEKALDQIANEILAAKSDLEPIAYPGNHLPWDVFWKKVPRYRQGDMFLYVEDLTYTPMTDVIKAGIFGIPMDMSVAFIYEGKMIQLTFMDLLLANGVNLTPGNKHYLMVQGMFHRSGVYIRADYSNRLHSLKDMMNGTVKEEQFEPIHLTPEQPPLICIKPNVFMRYLGRRIHGAVIVDTSGDREPLPDQTYLTTKYTESIPFNVRHRILILHDVGTPIQQIARETGCLNRSIQETIGTRLLIERQFIAQYLEENPQAPPDSILTPTSSSTKSVGEMMRPKSKIRRTHYVDLNKLVWKHFKECQAAGIQINGKNLKDQAMRYAKEMGLESFRGSEGWLDAFKRRHKIDLKTMTGYPVCYENDMFDEVDKECRDLDMESHHLHQQNSQHQNPFGAPEEFAHSFLSQFNGFQNHMLPPPQPEPTAPSTHLQNMINMMATSNQMVDNSRTMQNGVKQEETVQNVFKSCTIKVQDKEVAHALDTLRNFILAHDPPAMQLFLQIQERLAIAAQKLAITMNDGLSTEPN